MKRERRPSKLWRRSIVLSWLAAAGLSPVVAQEKTPDIPVQSSEPPVDAALGDSAAAAEQLNRLRDVALSAIDEVIAASTQPTTAEQWKQYRTFIETDAGLENYVHLNGGLLLVVQRLRNRSQLLAAQKVMPHVIEMAKLLERERSEALVYAHAEMAILEADFENYEKALEHMTLALKGTEEGAAIKPHIVLACKANRAMILGRLGRVDDAEQIYLDLLANAEESSSALSIDESLDLRFALTGLYSRHGRFEKALDTVPRGKESIYNQKGEFVAARAFAVGVGFVRYYLADGKDVEQAAAKGEELIERAQEEFGVSSREYIELIELMAKVRVAQSRYDDAIELLNKSARIRAGLLGTEHPSIARVRAEIESTRKQSLENPQPVWTPLQIDRGKIRELTQTAR